jgi:hypothetical protein
MDDIAVTRRIMKKKLVELVDGGGMLCHGVRQIGLLANAVKAATEGAHTSRILRELDYRGMDVLLFLKYGETIMDLLI